MEQRKFKHYCVCSLSYNLYSFYFAVGTVDYEEVETILMFRSCETRVCTNVAIVDDIVAELTERFSVKLNRTDGLDQRITLDPVVVEVEIMDKDGE